MLILGLDTSGKNGSLALVRFEGDGAHTLEIVPLEGGTFSAQLIPQVSALLSKRNLTKHDVDAFAVVSGPGSFTGLRVGLAAIKALAEILQKPIAPVSLLEVVARAANAGQVIALLDAGREEAFAGTYDFENRDAAEELLTIPELRNKPADYRFVTPDQKLADVLRAKATNVSVVPQPRADAIAILGYKKILMGETVTPEALDATYIRRSDAEIMRSDRVR